MLLNGNGDNQNNSLLVEPFVWYFFGGILVQLGPFPGALPSFLLVLLRDRIPCEFEFSTSSVTTQKCHGSSYMHSIKLVHNLTISIFFLRSSCPLSSPLSFFVSGILVRKFKSYVWIGSPHFSEKDLEEVGCAIGQLGHFNCCMKERWNQMNS